MPNPPPMQKPDASLEKPQDYDIEAVRPPSSRGKCAFFQNEVFTQKHIIAITLGFARDLGWAGAAAADALQFLEISEPAFRFFCQTMAQCAVGGGAIALAALAIYFIGKKINPKLTISEVVIPMIASWTTIPGWNAVCSYGGDMISKGAAAALGEWNEGWLPGPFEAPWQQLANWLCGADEKVERERNGVMAAIQKSIKEYFTAPGLLQRIGLSLRDAALFSPAGSIWQFVYLAVFEPLGGNATRGLSFAGSLLTGVAVAGGVATTSTLSQLLKVLSDKCCPNHVDAKEEASMSEGLLQAQPVNYNSTNSTAEDAEYLEYPLVEDGDGLRAPASLCC